MQTMQIIYKVMNFIYSYVSDVILFHNIFHNFFLILSNNNYCNYLINFIYIILYISLKNFFNMIII